MPSRSASFTTAHDAIAKTRRRTRAPAPVRLIVAWWSTRERGALSSRSLSARRAGASSGGVRRRSLAAACGRRVGERGREESSRAVSGSATAMIFRAVCVVCVTMYRFCQLADRFGWRKTAVLELENGTVYRESASLGRWGVLMWQRRTKKPACTIPFFGCTNSLSARAARRLLPRAPGARSSQLKVTKTRTNGRPKRTGAHLRAMEATRPAGDRRGAPGSVLRLDLPPPS